MQKVDLTVPIASAKPGPQPLVVRVLTTLNNAEFVGGVPSSNQRWENYVLLSVLPTELQERVKIAIQALSSSF